MEPTCKVMVCPSSIRTRILVMQGPDEILRAALPPPSIVRHERAESTLLEGLALWLGCQLSVVLCVPDEEIASCLGLIDGLGMGQHPLAFRVEVQEQGRRRRGKRLGGVGVFTDVRQMWLDAVIGKGS
jgi:hypothetical protein